MSKKSEEKTASNDVTKPEKREKREPVIYLGPPVRTPGIPVHLATNQTWTDRPKLPRELRFLYPFFVPPIEAFKLPTSLVPPVRVSTGLPFVVGVAPGRNSVSDHPAPVNEPRLIYSYKEFVDVFGWDDDTGKWTLCEFAKVYFGLYNVCPIVFVNVFDPAVHKTGDTPDVSKVESADIIGGIDPDTGKKTGLELISEVFPRFRLVVGSVVCPGYSIDPTVAVTMSAKARAINGLFRAQAIVDVPETVDKYSDVPGYTEANNLTDEHMVVCWPRLKYGDSKHWMSSHVAGLMSAVDGELL